MGRTSRLLRLAQTASCASTRPISTNGTGLPGGAPRAVGGASATNAPRGAVPATGSFQQTRSAVSAHARAALP